ncbi:Pentatricopeptide repeat-containing protein [Quillaja saponaria]|uniref:Pentatricopeptide repeat-containing protein n=1 Tax=Quillaja saponaria TaxID=32244 RepID=A0AAD7LQM7_QUISA|nr:Pentatricopeptide repeat-containing protein [Quillaja saponaria]
MLNLSFTLHSLFCVRQPSLISYKFFEKIRIYKSLLVETNFKFHTFSHREPLVSSLIFALKSSSSVFCCRVIHARVIRSVDYRDGFIGDQLVSGYVNMGFTEDAEKLFDEMPNKDLVSWNSLISGYSRRVYLGKCMNAFLRMKFEVGTGPDELTLISIISACTCEKALDEGKYLHGLAVKLERNTVSWNSVVAISTLNRIPEEAVWYFNMMRMSGLFPDEATMVALLQACEQLHLRKLAEAIHGSTFICGLNRNLAISTTLLNLYAKLGKLNDSCNVFGEIIKPDKVAWTAMLASYAMHGCGKEAREHFESMVRNGVEPDHVTFTHLLSACSHSGLLEYGKYYFNIMTTVYRVDPRLDHYSCMVDLLGRSGLVNDAYELIKTMPIEPNSGVWGALLGACRVYGNTQLGKEAAEKLIALDPSDPRNYIMLSNIYSAAGLWKDASYSRALMKDRGLSRNPGCSIVEHGNKIHCFVVDDHSHPYSDKIYRKLEELIRKICEAGFVSKTESVLHDVDEEVKVGMVNKHSEKIAIAYGLLVTNVGMPIVIMKNLRICGDCHSTAKFVSLIEKRTIIIRDSKRFHHFSDGSCSCGDYW